MLVVKTKHVSLENCVIPGQNIWIEIEIIEELECCCTSSDEFRNRLGRLQSSPQGMQEIWFFFIKGIPYHVEK